MMNGSKIMWKAVKNEHSKIIKLFVIILFKNCNIYFHQMEDTMNFINSNILLATQSTI
jgi:hypothetical protein